MGTHFRFAVLLVVVIFLVLAHPASFVYALKATPTPTPTPTESPVPTPTSEPAPAPRADLTQKSTSSDPLEKVIRDQKLGPVFPTNVLKYAIRNAVNAGVPANTLVLLLLLPLSASVIAAMRQIIGVRGFGIFLPAALSVVFVATGPVVGIGMFLLIVAVSTTFRIVLRRAKLRLLYLPRMALQLWAVVTGVLVVLLVSPFLHLADLTTISIFPILILALLAEDFSKVQLGKSAKTAINITSETLFLAFVSYIFLTLYAIQLFAVRYPEMLLASVAVIDMVLGRFVGLRVLEIWRFRSLIRRK